VDWEARVYVNGQEVGSHKGGYTPFCFDITGSVKDGPNELVVRVFDDTRSGRQGTGKQAHSQASEGCVYTRTTGIWQTVWLEATGETWVKEFALTPDIEAGARCCRCRWPARAPGARCACRRSTARRWWLRRSCPPPGARRWRC